MCADAHVCLVHVCAHEIYKCVCLVHRATLFRREVCELCTGGCLGTFLGLSVHLCEELGGRHPGHGGKQFYGEARGQQRWGKNLLDLRGT